MEIALNLIWLLLAAIIVRLWFRHAPKDGVSRMTQIAALAMLILILFPVISVSDDLIAARNFAEDDIFVHLRRNSTVVTPHSIVPATFAVPASAPVGLSFVLLGLIALGFLQVRASSNPALISIENRPPPSA